MRAWQKLVSNEVRLSRKAFIDFDEIQHWHEKEGYPERGLKIIKDIRTRIAKLKNPNISYKLHNDPALAKLGVHVINQKGFYIFYLTYKREDKRNIVLIARTGRSTRDWDSILSNEDWNKFKAEML